MTQVILTAKAREDLLRLREFLVWKNPIAAKKATAILVEAIDGLAEFPEMGKPIEALPNMRVLTKSFGKAGYKIYYRWMPQSEILAQALTIAHNYEIQLIDFAKNMLNYLKEKRIL